MFDFEEPEPIDTSDWLEQGDVASSSYGTSWDWLSDLGKSLGTTLVNTGVQRLTGQQLINQAASAKAAGVTPAQLYATKTALSTPASLVPGQASQILGMTPSTALIVGAVAVAAVVFLATRKK
jgi:hypothetical protein